ncbi:unnamed protein product [Thelazia callipaeda]|uniref:Actin maturation protease n=1 Tax=Thelazia callipaeda TaxID=103827 RepID=A0A0N5CQC9_THECL|nr:unnamed protein product [Thelazia callipaeda]
MIVDACKLPGPNLDEILKIAKQKGYTKYGEMFSADWLADIVISLCPTLDVEVQNLPSATQMEHLIQESAYLLIPYDCDKNHEPSFFAGHSAHWCVVVGFFCPVSGMVTTTWNTMTDHICSKDTLVFCVHGKSRHLAVWNYSQLIASNLNIREATNRVDDFVIPSTDLSTLRNRCLVIRHRLKAL